MGILTGRSWHFSNISSDISAPWAHESNSLDVCEANGMETSHAKRIFSNNVTCFGTNKCCLNGSHLSGCFKCSSFLACQAPRVQLSIGLTAFKTFCWNKLGILTGRSHFSNISSDMYAPPAHESTSLDGNKANEMLTSHAKRIFCDRVTCFGTNKC